MSHNMVAVKHVSSVGVWTEGPPNTVGLNVNLLMHDVFNNVLKFQVQVHSVVSSWLVSTIAELLESRSEQR